MKSFEERNLFVVGLVGVGVTVVLVLAALNFERLPFVNQDKDYSAYFSEASGLIAGAPVQVSGFAVGKVSTVELDGSRVLVNFNVAKNVRLGDRTELAVKTKSLLGAKILEVTPRGDGQQSGPIPLDRTRPAYQLPDALGDLTETISGLDTTKLSDSLAVLAETFSETPPDLRIAVDGVARFSETLNQRDAELRRLLTNANKATTVLAERSDQVVSLIVDTNALLVALKDESSALDQILVNASAVSKQVNGLIADNRSTLRPALEKLSGVLKILADRKTQIQKAIKGLNRYALGLGEAVSSGPFFKAYVVNLFPGQFVQPFIDAAFSDLGLDPAVLLPSERTDPQVGQPGTPPLPLPFPRTGQGGDPNLFLPDTITGKPGDPRYPYREPLPQAPPGGPPPGPPAGYQPTPAPQAPVLYGPGAPGPAGVTPIPVPPQLGPPGPAPVGLPGQEDMSPPVGPFQFPAPGQQPPVDGPIAPGPPSVGPPPGPVVPIPTEGEGQ